MIIITGASRGIGKYLLTHYVKKGEQVLGIANSTIPDDEICQYYYQLDIRSENAVKHFVNGHADKWNNIILINAAGISYSAFAHKTDMEQWREVIDTNLIWLFSVIKEVLPIMRNNNYGRIINLSSVVAQRGVAGTSAYASSKSALWGLTKTLAVENASKNITVNNINLGYFNIGMIDRVPQQLLTTIIDNIPAKRLGNPEEILNSIDYIISTAYLNGSSIDLNGGLF